MDEEKWRFDRLYWTDDRLTYLVMNGMNQRNARELGLDRRELRLDAHELRLDKRELR